jgi:hypothetical protein
MRPQSLTSVKIVGSSAHRHESATEALRESCFGVRSSRRSGPSGVADVAGGEALLVVVGVVGLVVVEGAEQEAIGEVGVAAFRPGFVCVVGFAPGGGDVAAVGLAVPVAVGECFALGR